MNAFQSSDHRAFRTSHPAIWGAADDSGEIVMDEVSITGKVKQPIKPFAWIKDAGGSSVIWVDPVSPSWTYQTLPDGSFKIIKGSSGVGSVVRPGTAAHAAIDSRWQIAQRSQGGGAASVLTAFTSQLPGIGPGLTSAIDDIARGNVATGLSTAAGTGASAAISAVAQKQAMRGDPDQLRAKLAKLSKKYASAKTAKKREKILAEIRGIKAALDTMESGGSRVAFAPVVQDTSLPSWLLPAGAGVALVAVLFIVGGK